MKFAIIAAAAAARYSTIVVVVVVILGAFLAMHPPPAATSAYAQSTTTATTATTANGSTGPADFNIAAVGDWGCESATEDTVDNIISKSPEVVIGLGDNSYDDSADCWFETVDPIIDKMITAIGNEDLLPSGKVDEYMNRFGLSEQYYTYRYGNVFVLVMSQEVPDEEGSAQFDFVERSLSEASSDPNVDWIIVAYHKLMYTSPSSSATSSGLAETYHELFEENDVDLVLQGHIHNYERSVPILFNDDDSDSPIPTSTNGKTYVDPEGQIFATVGTGGQSIMNFDGKNPYIVTQYEGYGFLDIEVKNGREGIGEDDVVQSDDTSDDDVVQSDDNSDDSSSSSSSNDDNSEDGNDAGTLKATFYANDGSIIDTFTIVKN
jgi:predicted phosphodiesterase